MHALGEAFTGRSKAYDEALNVGEGEALAIALARNVLGRTEPAYDLAGYVRQSDAGLAASSLDGLRRDGPRFARPQTVAPGDRP